MEIKDFINNSIESTVSEFKHTPSDIKLEKFLVNNKKDLKNE